MREIELAEFEQIMRAVGVRGKLRKELRWTPDSYELYGERELLAVSHRGGRNGLLLIDIDANLYGAPYELLPGIRDAGGRSKPVICDFCYTWQRGSNIGRITFRLEENRTVTFICCADLQCSLHVRNLTPASLLSRTQLREDITPERRIVRLRAKLESLAAALGLQPTAGVKP